LFSFSRDIVSIVTKTGEKLIEINKVIIILPWLFVFVNIINFEKEIILINNIPSQL